MVKKSAKVIISFWVFLTFGCAASSLPPEVKLAETQERSLWRSGADIYTPEEYSIYISALKKGKDDIIKEQARFVLFRNYKPVETEFREILRQGDEILKKIQDQKSNNILNQLAFFKDKIENLKGLTFRINEGRHARKDIIKAELLISEINFLCKNNDYDNAGKKLSDVSAFIEAAEDTIAPILNRYVDKNQIARWQRLVDDIIVESRDKETVAIVVNKGERSLTIYKGGIPFGVYSVGLGRNGSKDKLYAGDGATPEGRYRIIRKLAKSHYYKALLINYPNEEDRRQFIREKRRGHIPHKAGIGGLIEIHGGGKDNMTYGCIALDNKHMDEVFNLVNVGTPVAIVGAVDYENSIAAAIKRL